jgi:hypothetical protein
LPQFFGKWTINKKARLEAAPFSLSSMKSILADCLLDRAADVRENIVGVGADEADGADYDDENYREHDGILGYVLTLFVVPEFGD